MSLGDNYNRSSLFFPRSTYSMIYPRKKHTGLQQTRPDRQSFCAYFVETHNICVPSSPFPISIIVLTSEVQTVYQAGRHPRHYFFVDAETSMVKS
mmetsp:Transcript_14280/g.34496  ORF Transcript_14280/g.34496 Transcript_14280/m.34496 type:complete len:95 (-) Transcript_14280:526-810(-)